MQKKCLKAKMKAKTMLKSKKQHPVSAFHLQTKREIIENSALYGQ